MKLLLPAMVCILVIMMIAWPQLVPEDQAFQVETLEEIAQQAQTLSMLNPKFTGFDKKRRPYAITADVASHKVGDSENIDLLLPKGDITLEDGAWLAVEANQGHYKRDRQSLHLEGQVNLFHDQGFEVRSEEAHVDLDQGNIWGDLPVQGQGPAGTIESEGFRLYDRGARIVFTGKSHLLLYQGTKGVLQ